VNWTWELRTNDGAMNGLEFARCTTAGGFSRVLVHACPARASVEVRDDGGARLCGADLERRGDYSPITLLELDGDHLQRSEVWPDDSFYGLPVLLAGGEVGLLRHWEHAPDRSWWRWSVEFSNHTGRPADWHPDGQDIRR
jgi:hypothetical protein